MQLRIVFGCTNLNLEKIYKIILKEAQQQPTDDVRGLRLVDCNVAPGTQYGKEHNMGRNISYLAKGCIFIGGSHNYDNNNMSYYVYEIY